MRFSVLASGSGGNACYIETAEARILIDAGLSCRELIRRLELIEVAPDHLDALVITHEHNDHISGAGPISRRFDAPVFSNAPTFKKCLKILGKISRPVTIRTGMPITIKDILIETFTKCHDAVDPMGLTISSNGAKLGIVTDLGRSTSVVEERLKECGSLIIEFNHDTQMLENGPYPLRLKRRIKGPEGHLSNSQASDLLAVLSHEKLKHVIVAHISRKNNIAEKAVEKARAILEVKKMENTEVIVSHQDYPIPMMEI